MPTPILLNPALKDGGPRQFRRFTVSLPARVWDAALRNASTLDGLSLDAAVHAQVMDMSLTGLFFISDTVFPLETCLWVRLELRGQVIQVPVQARRKTEETLRGVRAFGCGVQFLRSPTTAQALPVLAAYLLTRPEAALYNAPANRSWA